MSQTKKEYLLRNEADHADITPLKAGDYQEALLEALELLGQRVVVRHTVPIPGGKS